MLSDHPQTDVTNQILITYKGNLLHHFFSGGKNQVQRVCQEKGKGEVPRRCSRDCGMLGGVANQKGVTNRRSAANQEECDKSKGVTKSGKTWANQEGVAEKGCDKRGGVWQTRRGVANE